MKVTKSPLNLLLQTTLLTTSLTLAGCSDDNANVQKNTKNNVLESTTAGAIKRVASESLSGSYAQMRAQQISQVSYNLAMTLDSKSEHFFGTNELSFELVKGNKDPLTIDFEQGEISSITVNGESAKFSYDKWFITIAPESLSDGNNTVAIDFSRPYATDGSGLHRFVDPENSEVYLYSDFEPYDANRMFPHFDQPDLKAKYTLTVTAPSQWQVISAARESEIKTIGETNQWFFPETAKISSYVFSLHAGDYVVWQDMYEDKHGEIPLRLFARKSLAKYVKTDDWFTPTKQSFAFFNEYFDIPYPFGKYDQIMAPDFNSGAMENVAAVTFNEAYVSRGEKSTRSKMGLANTIAHEMAHMWFGDLVTMKWWNGLWLNESFATYMANLQISKASDFKNNWDVFYSGTKQWAYRTDDSVNTHAIELPVNTTGDAMTNFDGITYGKGASVLKQLPYYLGHENFRIGVSNYLKKFAYKNTDLDDFIGELGKAANKDLTQWTQDWLYNAGLNTIEVNYQCQAGKISDLSIKQTATDKFPTLREQRVQVGLYHYQDNVMALNEAIAVTYKGENTQVSNAIGKTCPDLVYPNEADWGYVKVNLDEKSLAAVYQHINAIDNTTMRLMLWQSLADSVKDAKLSPEKFVDFAIANISAESDYNVIRKIAGSLTSSLNYLDSATEQGIKDYTAKHKKVEDLFHQLLLKAQAGSDIQKLWYARFVSSVESKANLAILAAILDGKASFEGLTIDQDKRWSIIAKLNHYQIGEYETRLTQEKLQDDSDSGVKSAIYAEVLRPHAAPKAKWFDVVLNNPEKLKLSTLRYIIWGLFPPGQETLEAPYKDRILAHIPKLNNGSDLSLLGAFSGLIPAECSVKSEKELAELVTKYQGMKPQILKSVKGKHESVDRCVKVLATFT